ncbi:hypothetical protein FRC04_004854 [Tulasnella sp. 424]|nr:hypothetical protein FRC04_004854 [Tulasnella sp. 424]KAG8963596.1 hypothetical protein FRC05_004605 [Tulasnella sp. 425]
MATPFTHNRLASSTGSIHALPPELLGHVFLYIYQDPSVPRALNDVCNTHKLTFIMLVRKGWKNIVECTPILWTDMWLGRSPYIEGEEAMSQWAAHLDTMFKRSGALPLSLTILVTCIDLEQVIQILLQHLPRCETLILRGLEDDSGSVVQAHLLTNTSSDIYQILSSPLPMAQSITIHDFTFSRDPEFRDQRLWLDTPNLRFLSSSLPDIIPFVKPLPEPLSIHGSLEHLSISGGWEDVSRMLPPSRLSLPRLKYFRVEFIDLLWDLLRVLHTPNLEHFVVHCALAEWPEQVHTPITMLDNLQTLEWSTGPDALNEETNLHHLLRHCQNITSFSYICDSEAVLNMPEYLAGETVDAFKLLSQPTPDGSPQLCPKLQRLHLASANFLDIEELVIRRPALEFVSVQCRDPADEVVTGSEATWHAAVDRVRWIRSKVEFEFPICKSEDGLQEMEGVVWNPVGTTSDD